MNGDIKHPGEFITKSICDTLRTVAYEAEQMKTLHEQQIATIWKQNWFNLYVPKSVGGMELSLPEILRLEEGIAWADGSSAWVVTLCSGAAWFVGFLDRALAATVFQVEHTCFAGSGAVTGVANRSISGYEINGYWPHATGSLFATVFTVNCIVKEDGVDVRDTDGNPLVASFLLFRDEVTIHRTWQAMGMIATGSHAIEARNISIPLSRSFIIDPEHAVLPDPIFQYPFLQLAETTLAVNLSGMACRFLDLCERGFTAGAGFLEKISSNRDKLKGTRNAFYNETDTAWKFIIANRVIPEQSLTAASRVSHALVNCSREVINTLYPYAGLAAADFTNEINRVWRNFHTAGQHGLFRNPARHL